MKSYNSFLKRLYNPFLIIFILIGLAAFLIGVITGVQSRIPVLESSLIETKDRVKSLEISIRDLNIELSNSLKSQEFLHKTLNEERDTAKKDALNSKSTITKLHLELSESIANNKLEQNKIFLITGEMIKLKNKLAILSNELEASEIKRKLTQNKLENELVTLSLKLSEAISKNVKIEDDAKLERIAARNRSLELKKIISKLRFDIKKYKRTEPEVGIIKKGSENKNNNEVTDVFSKSSPLLVGPIRQGIEAYNRSDYVKAYEIWLPLALDGSKRAQFFIGALYFEGRGVKQNIIRSYLWLHRANESGDKAAPVLIGRLKKIMSPAELNEVQRRIITKDSLPIK